MNRENRYGVYRFNSEGRGVDEDSRERPGDVGEREVNTRVEGAAVDGVVGSEGSGSVARQSSSHEEASGSAGDGVVHDDTGVLEADGGRRVDEERPAANGANRVEPLPPLPLIRERDRRVERPASELDMSWMTTNTDWGEPTISPELREMLGRTELFVDPEGNQFLDVNSLWGLLSYFRRDLRLGNLSSSKNEVAYCQRLLDLAGDCLRAGYVPAFLSSLSRVISVIELSQSRGGFFRRRAGTLTSENISENREPKKPNLIGSRGGRK